MDSNEILMLEKALLSLQKALGAGRSTRYCHALWSRFVRMRDKCRCVMCGSSERIAAHHIFRKSLLSYARFDTGNGISLCHDCHSEAHVGFNGRPDLDKPMDAQGGEKLEIALDFLSALLDRAREEDILRDDFYFFSDAALRTLKLAQSIEENVVFPGLRLEQAWRIWRQTPRSVLKALFKANGFTLPDDFIQPDNGSFIIFS